MPKKKTTSTNSTPDTPKRKGPKRNTSRSMTVHSDLFVTTVSNLMRHTGYTNPPQLADYTPIAHQHYFRTVNADGNMEKTTSPVGGHFHDVEIVKDEKGEPKLNERGEIQIKVGPPVQIQKVGKGKNIRFVPMRIELYKTSQVVDYEEVATKHYDEHTHEAMYVRSDEMKIRSMSAEAQSIIQKLSANVAPPPVGIDGHIGDRSQG